MFEISFSGPGDVSFFLLSLVVFLRTRKGKRNRFFFFCGTDHSQGIRRRSLRGDERGVYVQKQRVTSRGRKALFSSVPFVVASEMRPLLPS